MEHVPLPGNSVFQSITVPCLSSDSLESTPFADIIEKTKWSDRLPEIFNGATDVDEAEWTQLSTFLQGWLFFGLLSAFLDHLYDRNDFVSPFVEHADSVVTTAKLNDLLRELVQSEMGKAEGERRENYLQRGACLQQAADVLNRFPEDNKLDPPVHLSICVLYEKLCAANALIAASWKTLPPHASCVTYGRRILKRLHAQPGSEPLPDPVKAEISRTLAARGLVQDLESTQSSIYTYGDSVAFEVGAMAARFEAPVVAYEGPKLKLIEDRLVSAGWCPSERSILFSNYNATCQFYASHFSRPGMDKDHVLSGCSDAQCLAYTIDFDTYKTSHWPPSCNCELVPISLERVNAILARDIVPSFTLQQGRGDVSINVEATKKDSYIAISHVWSDGLGNPKGNALPKCQLIRLCDYYRASNLPDKPVWIDTLCVPREPLENRRAAIKLMRDTYSAAEHVIVLDHWLNKSDASSSSAHEVMFRVALSGWSRRLWTLQEGMLNTSALVWFRDRLVDVDGLVQNMSLDQSLEYLPMTRPLAMAYGLLRGMVRRNLDIRTKLMGMSLCLQYRSTSWKGDEPLCLGTLLDLDVGKIWDQKADERMKELWAQVSDVPVDVAFDVTPKLPQVGFRWAPSTLFGHSLAKHTGGSFMAGRWTGRPGQGLGKVTDHGLLAEIEGFVGNEEISILMHSVHISMVEFVDQRGQPYLFFRKAAPLQRDLETLNKDSGESQPKPVPGRWAILVLGYRPLPQGILTSPAILGITDEAASCDTAPRRFSFVDYGNILKFRDKAQHAQIRPFKGSFVASEHSLEDAASVLTAMYKTLSEGSISADLASQLDVILDDTDHISIPTTSGDSSQVRIWTFENLESCWWTLD